MNYTAASPKWAHMDTRSIIELVTLLGGVITAVYGSISSIRQRRAADAELAAVAGAPVVSHARAVTDIAGLDPSYLAQVSSNMTTLENKLEQAEALLRQHGIIKG